MLTFGSTHPKILTDEQRQQLIDVFLASGESDHTLRAATLPPILNHAVSAGLPFGLYYLPGAGWKVVRAIEHANVVPPAALQFIIRNTQDVAEKRAVVSSLRVTRCAGHVHLELFNRGGRSGELVVLAEDFSDIATSLIPPACWDVEVLR